MGIDIIINIASMPDSLNKHYDNLFEINSSLYLSNIWCFDYLKWSRLYSTDMQLFFIPCCYNIFRKEASEHFASLFLQADRMPGLTEAMAFTDSYKHMACLGGMRLQSFLILFTRATLGTPASIYISFTFFTHATTAWGFNGLIFKWHPTSKLQLSSSSRVHVVELQ